MQLYLSSYKLGSRATEFANFFTNKKVGLIANALDASTDLARKEESRQRDHQELKSIGLEPVDLDLRDYFGKKAELKQKLTEFGGIWVRGGNTFVLRRAMAYCGLDEILHELRSSTFVYGSSSAGSCVMASHLEAIQLADDPTAVPDGYQPEIMWDGLGFLPYAIMPHYRSEHQESALVEKCVQYAIDHKILFVALRDGEVIVEKI